MTANFHATRYKYIIYHLFSSFSHVPRKKTGAEKRQDRRMAELFFSGVKRGSGIKPWKIVYERISESRREFGPFEPVDMTPGVVWQIHVHTGTYPAALAAEKRYIDGTSVVVMVATAAAAAAAGVMVQEGLDW